MSYKNLHYGMMVLTTILFFLGTFTLFESTAIILLLAIVTQLEGKVKN